MVKSHQHRRSCAVAEDNGENLVSQNRWTVLLGHSWTFKNDQCALKHTTSASKDLQSLRTYSMQKASVGKIKGDSCLMLSSVSTSDVEHLSSAPFALFLNAS